tara:strand:- start:595 stop:729 length:135 start_codon:yes stop_codon:yes gene_type:complete
MPRKYVKKNKTHKAKKSNSFVDTVVRGVEKFLESPFDNDKGGKK